MITTYSRIKTEDTAAVVIDVQEKLYPFIFNNDILTKNITRFLGGLKILNVPIIVTQQYTKGIGGTIEPINQILGDSSHIEKLSFSCCGEKIFIEELKKIGKKNILLSGIESHVCVMQTCLDLLDLGYLPVLIEDCVSSRNPNDKQIAVERMRNAGAIVSTYESILFELTVASGTEQFKAISRLVK
jgi:nicotinamidase-related amidase